MDEALRANLPALMMKKMRDGLLEEESEEEVNVGETGARERAGWKTRMGATEGGSESSSSDNACALPSL